MIRLKRAYKEPSKEDRERILVDRLWVGLTKQRAKIDLWIKDVAPSTELRKWFGHDPKRWKEFSKRFLAELKQKKKELVHELKKKARKGTITLIYAARDEEHNEALVLKKLLSSRN